MPILVQLLGMRPHRDMCGAGAELIDQISASESVLQVGECPVSALEERTRAETS